MNVRIGFAELLESMTFLRLRVKSHTFQKRRKGEDARVPLLLDVLLTKQMGEDIRVPLGKEGCPLIEILLYSVMLQAVIPTA